MPTTKLLIYLHESLKVIDAVTLSTPDHGPLLQGPEGEPGAVPGENRTTLARLLAAHGQGRTTGVIEVAATDGAEREEKHELFLRLGRVVHVRPPHLDEPLGHILCGMGLLDRETYAKSLMRMSEERARHGTVLKQMGIVNDEQLAGALAVQVLRRSARMFRLRDGSYRIDLIEHEHGRPEDGEIAARGVGVRRVIYNGVLTGYDASDLAPELKRLAGCRMRLRREEARRLGRYGFGREARRVLELLSTSAYDVPNLLLASGARPSDSTTLLKVVYTLLVTDMLEIEQPRDELNLKGNLAVPWRPPGPARPPSTLVRPIAEPKTLVSAGPGARRESIERLRKSNGRRSAPEIDMGPDPRLMEGQARFARGEAYLRRGEIEMALANLKAAVSLMPHDPDGKAMLALALWKQPDVPVATRAYRARQLVGHALRNAPSCARAYRVLGTIYAEQGSNDQASRCFLKALQLVPDDPDANRELQRLERRRSRGSLFGLFRRK